jgi:hypothetical protein
MTDGRLKEAAAQLRRLADGARPAAPEPAAPHPPAPAAPYGDDRRRTPAAGPAEPPPGQLLQELRAQTVTIERLERRVAELAALVESVAERPAGGRGLAAGVLVTLALAACFAVGTLFGERALAAARPWLDQLRAATGL